MMNSIIKKMNREIMGYIRHLDVDPGKERPVTFWFYSEEEEKIYHLASRLQENGYWIDCCEYTEISDNYICIAEKSMNPDADMEKLFVDMQLLADRLGVTFDGWETEGRRNG